MRRKNREVESWFKPSQEPVCPLCERLIPESQQDKHHLIPRLKGGRHTEMMHRICHRQLHALFTEAELAQHYSTVDALLVHPEVRKFVEWVKTKPNDFYASPKMSNRKR